MFGIPKTSDETRFEMSQKKAKQIRRAVRKESQKIKVQGLEEFINFTRSQSFFKRLNFALKIVFRRIR